MGMDGRMRNITVKITVEVFIITISDLYLISYFIMHLHKFYVYQPPLSFQSKLELF